MSGRWKSKLELSRNSNLEPPCRRWTTGGRAQRRKPSGDRKKDTIITGGFNVYPSEIEQVIWTHNAVQDCAVIGIPDEKWGEAVKAVIELKPGFSTDEDEIIALCKGKLGSVKAPKTVEFWDELPRSPVGKVLKKDIRKPYWEGHERSVS
ncbi:MAG TPA: hypothetical protein EYQ81_00995 [Sneathiellales bacterium]|nr:hypothetical protein [Sneathiellales bacterium]